MRRKNSAVRLRQHIALELDDYGWTYREIAKVVERKPDTVKGWLLELRGPKGSSEKEKCVLIRKLIPEGLPAEEIARRAKATPRYVLMIMAKEAVKQGRRSPKQVIDDFFAGDRAGWDQIKLKEYKSRCRRLLKRVLSTTENAPREGIEPGRMVIEEIEGRREKVGDAAEHRDLTCLLALAIHLKAAAHRMAGELEAAQACFEHARQEGGDCQQCAAESHRQQGWIHDHLRSSFLKSDPSRAEEHARLSDESFSRAAALYKTFPHYRGHALHGNGLASALQGRSVLRFYCGDYARGLEDAEIAMEILDTKVSPGLVLPIVQAAAIHLFKLPGRKVEARAHVKGLLADMKPDKSLRYAKVLWLDGLLEVETPTLVQSRRILISQGLGREVSVISIDILATESTVFLQAESLECLGELTKSGELRLATFLEDAGDDTIGGLYRQLREGVALSLPALRRTREKLGGDDVMPALLFEAA